MPTAFTRCVYPEFRNKDRISEIRAGCLKLGHTTLSRAIKSTEGVIRQTKTVEEEGFRWGKKEGWV